MMAEKTFGLSLKPEAKTPLGFGGKTFGTTVALNFPQSTSLWSLTLVPVRLLPVFRTSHAEMRHFTRFVYLKSRKGRGYRLPFVSGMSLRPGFTMLGLQAHKPMKSFTNKILIFAVVMAALLGAGAFGRKAYKKSMERRLVSSSEGISRKRRFSTMRACHAR